MWYTETAGTASLRDGYVTTTIAKRGGLGCVLLPLAVLGGQRVEDPGGGDGRLSLLPPLLPADGARAALPRADVGVLGHPPRLLQKW